MNQSLAIKTKRLIKEFDLPSEGTTILLSPHMLSEMEQTVDRMAIFSNGSLIVGMRMFLGLSKKINHMEAI